MGQICPRGRERWGSWLENGGCGNECVDPEDNDVALSSRTMGWCEGNNVIMRFLSEKWLVDVAYAVS